MMTPGQYSSRSSFTATYRRMVEELLLEPPFNAGQWQSMDVSGSKLHHTHEMMDVAYTFADMAPTVAGLQAQIPADQPWAEDHFGERVGGKPLNPPPSHTRWPYAVRGNGDHTILGVFDHSYPERFWPKHAGVRIGTHTTNYGIRYPYGDLADVVALLHEEPLTRQAYLPVWFPEDTGGSVNQSGKRVPCTLGYHFMIRDNLVTCRYYMRSCDIYRHFTNDLYFAARLVQWVTASLNDLNTFDVRRPTLHPGKVIMHISSLHLFVGDVPKIKERLDQWR